MKRFIVPAVAAAIVASTSIAAFAAQNTTGSVKTIDSSAMSLTLDDGQTYQLPQNWTNPGLKKGDRVAVAYRSDAGKNMASSIEAIADGTVKTIDRKAMRLTLDDGQTYQLPAGFKNPDIRTGQRVAVNYRMRDGKEVASSVGMLTDGTVRKIDTNAMTLTLDDGKTFQLPDGWRNSAVKDGAKVSVNYSMNGSHNVAHDVMVRS